MVGYQEASDSGEVMCPVGWTNNIEPPYNPPCIFMGDTSAPVTDPVLFGIVMIVSIIAWITSGFLLDD